MAVEYTIYRVKAGDCLWTIARDVYKDPGSWFIIAKLNNLKPPYLLLVGMPLRVLKNVGPVTHPNPMTMGGEKKAVPTAYPTLTYKVENVQFLPIFPDGTAKVTAKGSLTLQRNGTFEYNLTSQGLMALQSSAKSGGFTVTTDAKPFTLNDPQSLSIKTEYGNKLASIFANPGFQYDAHTGQAELTLGIGWKFNSTEFEVSFTGAYIFKFAPQEVKATGIEGKISIEVEVRSRSSKGHAAAKTAALAPMFTPSEMALYNKLPTIRIQNLFPSQPNAIPFLVTALILAALAPEVALTLAVAL